MDAKNLGIAGAVGTAGLIVLCGGFLIFVIWVNIWNHRRRAKMTSEEKAQEDEDRRIPGDW